MESISWLKDAIEHVQETIAPGLYEINGETYVVSANGEYSQVERNIHHPEMLVLHSLDALVKLVKTEALHGAEGPVYISIPTPLEVTCFAQPDCANDCFRQVFYSARATDVPGWDSQVKMGFEETQIALRTRFQDTPDVTYVQKLLSDISTGAQITYNDNGIATKVVTSKGVALQGQENIRPIVTLRPYRTFQEVEQPESPFLIRVNERSISFTEADGGMWKLKARETIKRFLEAAFDDEERVIIAL